MTPLSAILTLVVPGVLVAAALLLASFRSSGPGSPRDTGPDRPPAALRRGHGPLARLAPPLAVAVAFFSADIGLNQWHAIWPTDGTQRFLAVAIVGALVGSVHALAPIPALRVACRAALGAGIALGLLSPVHTQFMPRPLLVGLTVGAAVWLPVVGEALERPAGKLPVAAVPAACLATALAAAPGLFASGYAGGAQLLAALGSMAGAMLLVAMFRPRSMPPLGGANTVWLGLLAAILLVTVGYVDAPAPWVLAGFAVAPLGALAALVPGRRWVRLTAPFLAAGLLAGGASVAATALGGDDDAGADEESPYGY